MTAVTAGQQAAPAKACRFIHPDGRACQATPQADSDYCFFHDPAKAVDRRLAQVKGGSQNSLKVLPSSDLRRWRSGQTPTAADLLGLLADTVDATLTGKIDPKVANAVGYLAGVMLRAVEAETFNERLQAVEEAVGVMDKQRQGRQSRS